MKEVELVGTIEEVYEKLKTHIGQKICQYGDDGKFESILTEVGNMDRSIIFIDTDPHGIYSYYHGMSPSFFLFLEEDDVFETFDEMVQRKQEEMLMKKCY